MPPADPNGPGRLKPEAYVLRIRQHPLRGKVLGKDKDRKPLDPPPVIQLFVRDPGDPAQNYLQSPYFWMAATLWHEKDDKPLDNGHQALTGSLTSSLHRLKDMDSHGQSRDGGFFVFGDLSCKIEGKFRLKIILYETLQGQIAGLAETLTGVFEVYNTKNFPGMQESTFMSRSFGDQGVRLRIRKESRQLMKRPASSYSPGQTHPSIPGYGAQPGYGGMGNGYNGQFMKTEEGLEESASKRQRSNNTSPTNYIERGSYQSMAPAAYANAAYADPASYNSNMGTMAIADSSVLAPSPVQYGTRYDNMQQNYAYYNNPRAASDTNQPGYPAAAFPSTNYPNGAPYYTNNGVNSGYPRGGGA